MYHPECHLCERPILGVELPDDYADNLQYYHPECIEPEEAESE